MDSSSISYGSSDESQEGQALLPLHDNPRLTTRERLSRAQFIPRQLGLKSKSAILILVWTLVVTTVSTTTKGGTSFAVNRLKLSHIYDIVLNHVLYVLAIFLYPIVGFIADVYCGRHKVVFISLCSVLCGTVLLSVVSVQIFANHTENPFSKIEHHTALFFIFSIAGLLLLIAGSSTYKATIIQFGLDQLLEAPSEYLGLFVHWFEWFTMLGLAFGQAIIAPLYNCSSQSKHSVVIYIIVSLPFIFLILICSLLMFTCWKHHWFYTEPAQNNPYKMVIKVINFARKHKYPLRRSAFTYTGDESPLRLDFAKERYGGPFTTEQVEDVKIFLRILVVLLALGPVFAMEVPIGSVLPIFIHHIVKEDMFKASCDWKRVMTDTYFLRFLMIAVVFPIYIWLIYSVLRRCIPKIFIRLCIGIITLLAGFLFIFLAEVIGHYLYYQHHGYGVVCMFSEVKHILYDHHLEIPWAVTLVPMFLTDAGLTLIITTTFEFISAQSPQSMKGLIFGVLFAIRASIKVIISLTTLLFSVNTLWGTETMMNHPPSIINCGFGYFLLMLIIGLVGFVVFSVVAKRYKYRERDDPPYNQSTVERVWANS